MKSLKKMSILTTVILSSYLTIGVSSSYSLEISTDNDKRCTLEPIEQSGIGDIKYSILSEAQFQNVNGKEWVLMKGQTFEELQKNQPFKQTGKSFLGHYINKDYDAKLTISKIRIPRAGGKFFRVLNNSGEHETHKKDRFEKENGKKRRLGEFQGDLFQAHEHSYIDFHIIYQPHNWRIWQNEGSSYRAEKRSNRKTINTNGRNGEETRPLNISFNAFIKIKRKCIKSLSSIEKHDKLIKDQQKIINDLTKKYRLLLKRVENM